MNENTEHCRSVVNELYEAFNEQGIDGIYEYLSDAMDVNYLVDANLDYKGVRILIEYGGPNVYVSTISGNVELYWWGDNASWSLDTDVIEAIDDIYREQYEMMKER